MFFKNLKFSIQKHAFRIIKEACFYNYKTNYGVSMFFRITPPLPIFLFISLMDVSLAHRFKQTKPTMFKGAYVIFFLNFWFLCLSLLYLSFSESKAEFNFFWSPVVHQLSVCLSIRPLTFHIFDPLGQFQLGTAHSYGTGNLNSKITSSFQKEENWK